MPPDSEDPAAADCHETVAPPTEDVKKGEIFLSLFYYDSWISARAFLNWKKNRIEVKVTARISAIGSAM